MTPVHPALGTSGSTDTCDPAAPRLSTAAHAKPTAFSARFCHLPWLEELLQVPPWLPEGDPSAALRARKL